VADGVEIRTAFVFVRLFVLLINTFKCLHYSTVMPFLKQGLQSYQRRKGGLFHLLEDFCEAPPDPCEDYAPIGNAAWQSLISLPPDSCKALK
jgi:hypothetical protein